MALQRRRDDAIRQVGQLLHDPLRGAAQADVARADTEDLPAGGTFAGRPATRRGRRTRRRCRAAPPRYPGSSAAADDLGPADVLQERGVPHQGVREELARGEDAEEDLQAHGLGQHLAQVRVRVRQRVEESLPVVERHVGVGPLGEHVAGQHGQAGEEGALLRFPADVPEVGQRARRDRQKPRSASALWAGSSGHASERTRSATVTTGGPGQAVPAEVPLHERAHLRGVRLEVEVQLLRRVISGSGCVAHAPREVQVFVGLRGREGRGPARSRAASAGR